jgi:hypothetical protein
MFIMENTSMGRYTNIGVADAFDTVLYFIKMCNHDKQVYKERVMARTISALSEMYEEHVKSYLSAKQGILRKHMYGTRSHFTSRAVITSMSGPHSYDEVHLPWGIGVTMMRPHLLNKLKKKGLRYKEASNLLYKSVQHYDPLVAECLRELVSESKYKGIPINIQRNPSLNQGSSILVYCTLFKEDVDDTTIDISIMLTKCISGDFDGDEMNVTLLLDNFMHDNFLTMQAHHSVPDMNSVYGVSGRLTLSSPVVATISNYLSNERERLSG